jgi:cytochrome c oxidase subunit I
MTAATSTATVPVSVVPRSKGRIVVSWITTTDHKTIGYMCVIASFTFFCLGGVMALLIRAELFEPGMQLLQTKEQYNQPFTMHGTIMLLMFATPLFAGFANVMMPLQIGAPDVAFPRLNALAFWFFLFGSLIAVSGFITPRAPHRSAGSRTLRCPTPPSPRESAVTSGSSASPSPVSARSWARSTSSPPSSACAPPA